MMDPVLARDSRAHFRRARILLAIARPIQAVARWLTGCVNSLISESRRQESIASLLWAEAIAAGKASEARR